MQRLVVLLALASATTAQADPPDPETDARTKIRYGKIAVGAGVVATAIGGGLVWYYSGHCERTGGDCVVTEVVMGGVIGIPLLAGGLLATGSGILKWWTGRKELDAALAIGAVPTSNGGMLAIAGAF